MILRAGVAIAASSVLAASGCSLYFDSPTPAPPPPPTTALPATADLDVLFVVTDAPDTLDAQALLASSFPALVDALDDLPGGRPDLHVGFIDTTVDLGIAIGDPSCPSPDPLDNGLLQGSPTGCPDIAGNYLIDDSNGSGDRTTNYTGTLGAAMQCLARPRDTGCGYTAPLEAMRRALDGSNPANTGFLRPDAALIIVLFTSQDDCSAGSALYALPDSQAGGLLRCASYGYTCTEPISSTTPGTYSDCLEATDSPYLVPTASYHDFLTGLRDPRRVALEVIAGEPSPMVTIALDTANGAAPSLTVASQCVSELGGDAMAAPPAIRLGDFAVDFGARATFDSACKGDETLAMSDVVELAHRVMAAAP